VKRSVRDEPMCVVIHMCMDATPGFCLYSYLYLKLAKTLSLLSLMFSLQQNQRTRGLNRFCPEAGIGGRAQEEVAQTKYTHMLVNVKTI
jgi:hypothetical protein